MTQRSARPGAIVPLGLIEAEELNIRTAVAEWCARQIPNGFSAQASYARLARMYLQWLRGNDRILDAAFITDLALSGHPPADQALRLFIAEMIEADRLAETAVSVRFYARRITAVAALGGYPPRTSKAVDHFLRDAALVILMRRVRECWPHVPLKNGQGRASISALVGGYFGLSERQARRIFEADHGQSRRVVEFMWPDRAMLNGHDIRN